MEHTILKICERCFPIFVLSVTLFSFSFLIFHSNYNTYGNFKLKTTIATDALRNMLQLFLDRAHSLRFFSPNKHDQLSQDYVFPGWNWPKCPPKQRSLLFPSVLSFATLEKRAELSRLRFRPYFYNFNRPLNY